MKRVPCSSARAISTIWRCSTLSSARPRASTSTSRPQSSSSCAPGAAGTASRPGPDRRGWRVEEQVLGDREARDDGRLLVDAGHLLAPRPASATPRRSVAGEADLAQIGASRPVSTATSVDLPAPLRPTSARSPARQPTATRRGAPGSRRSAWRPRPIRRLVELSGDPFSTVAAHVGHVPLPSVGRPPARVCANVRRVAPRLSRGCSSQLGATPGGSRASHSPLLSPLNSGYGGECSVDRTRSPPGSCSLDSGPPSCDRLHNRADVLSGR